jgi:hypothetical protein
MYGDSPEEDVKIRGIPIYDEKRWCLKSLEILSFIEGKTTIMIYHRFLTALITQ